MNIVIIGGSGFVGSRLIEYLQKNNIDKITNIDKKGSPFYNSITHIANVLDTAALTELLNGKDLVILLAAEHRDDVTPKSLYYDINVQGTKNVLAAMDANNIKRIVFTSSVAVYGLNKKNPNEHHTVDPFNEYGKTKWQAEEVLKAWQADDTSKNVNILRPTVIFGERNRGNVYTLLKQISSGKFMMIGSGNNKKSMAYVGNIVAFILFLIQKKIFGCNIYNYVDKPDFTMNELVAHISNVLNKKPPTTRIPYGIGMLGGYGFDVLAKLSGRKLNISSVRVKKFCATTQFDSGKAIAEDFLPPYTLGEGLANTLQYEFIEERDPNTDITFVTE